MANGAEAAFARRESPAALGADERDDFSFHGALLPASRVLPQGSATCYQSTSTVRLAVGGPPDAHLPAELGVRRFHRSCSRLATSTRRARGTSISAGRRAGWRLGQRAGGHYHRHATRTGSWPARLWAAFCSARVNIPRGRVATGGTVPLAFRSLRLVAAPLALCLTLAPPSLALTFSSSCDRFEIDGNTFGPADGTLDFVDEFDSGMLAPNWTVLLGSAQETGSCSRASSKGRGSKPHGGMSKRQPARSLLCLGGSDRKGQRS